jgi:hypothetical protein
LRFFNKGQRQGQSHNIVADEPDENLAWWIAWGCPGKKYVLGNQRPIRWTHWRIFAIGTTCHEQVGIGCVYVRVDWHISYNNKTI